MIALHLDQVQALAIGGDLDLVQSVVRNLGESQNPRGLRRNEAIRTHNDQNEKQGGSTINNQTSLRN